MLSPNFIIFNLFLCYEIRHANSIEKADLSKGDISNINSVDDLKDSIGEDKAPGFQTQYQPTWESIDSRPIPAWYDLAKFGIFIHWGVFSVPSFGTEWFWWYWKTAKDKRFLKFMEKNFKPNFTYADFGASFTAEFYEPEEWAKILESSGAKYVVLTSKHAEGYALWPSKYSWNWNAGDIGPGRDLVGELVNALRKHDLKVGLYYCLYEWFNPLFLQDQANNYTTNAYITTKIWPQLMELYDLYQPDIVWADGDVGPSEYWRSKEFIAHLYNTSPKKDTVVTNDRWGTDADCKHGGYLTCQDKYSPGKIMDRKWERCDSIDHNSWGLRREATLTQLMSIKEIIRTLIDTVSYGGNLLLNVGGSHDGRIIPIFQERLRQIGSWLKVNGDAIYMTKPWDYANEKDGTVWYTENCVGKRCRLYATILQWPPLGQDNRTKENGTWISLKRVQPYGSKGSLESSPEGSLEVYILIQNQPTEPNNFRSYEEFQLKWRCNFVDEAGEWVYKRSPCSHKASVGIQVNLNCPIMLAKLMSAGEVSTWAWVLKIINYSSV